MCKKRIALLFVSSMLVFSGCNQGQNNNPDTPETPGIEENQDKNSADIELTSSEAIKEARALLWDEYLEEIQSDESRKAEVMNRQMELGDVTMKYGLQIMGEPEENGYPLYIALHAGGADDTSESNYEQWINMTTYYGNSVTNGIYVHPQSISDTGNAHVASEVYPFYDRLIENMIAFCNADPNRVYLLGIKEGGDGVYAITPKMTDRFAAANMSLGYPNGIDLTNLYNMPIYLQGTLGDSDFNRVKATVEYDAVLENLSATYGNGYGDSYLHETFIRWSHIDEGVDDNEIIMGELSVLANLKEWLATGDETCDYLDTNAVRLVRAHTRTPLPERVVWEFTNRADHRDVESNYWLSASFDVNEGMIIASYDKETNTITIEKNTANGAVTVWINEDMLDVFSPITVKTPTETYEVNVTPDYELLKSTTYERGDENYQFVASIVLE